MPDPRFWQNTGPRALADLAGACGARLRDAHLADRPIAGVATLERANGSELSFVSGKRYLAQLKASAAGAVLLPEALADQAPDGVARLVSDDPAAAYARIAAELHVERRHEGEAFVHPDARLEDDVQLGLGVVIGPGAAVGRGTRLGTRAILGAGVHVGRGCDIGANVVLKHALVGDRVRILSGAVIGEAGFGVGAGSGGTVDLPQLGRVILQDGVSVGAATCIDRGAFDDTIIGEGTKIDNLVQVGHNCVIGRHCLLAGHVGLSGSVTVGDGVQFGGRAGIADHVTIGDRAVIMAAAGVMKDVEAGAVIVGAPARPVRQFMREVAWVTREAQKRVGARDEAADE